MVTNYTKELIDPYVIVVFNYCSQINQLADGAQHRNAVHSLPI